MLKERTKPQQPSLESMTSAGGSRESVDDKDDSDLSSEDDF